MPTAFPAVRHALATLACLTIASGCTGEALVGNLFEVNLRASENNCTTGGANTAETHEYRLVIDSLDVTLAIGEDEWAVGEIDGCRITYDSIVVTDLRNDQDGNQHEIRWRITGEAEIDQRGGVSCIEEPGVDWIGTETIEVVRSQHPAVDPGCTYSFDVTGRFTGFATEPEEDGTDLPPQ